MNKAQQQRLKRDGQAIRLSAEEVARLGDRVLMIQNKERLELFDGEAGRFRLRCVNPRRMAIGSSADGELFLGQNSGPSL